MASDNMLNNNDKKDNDDDNQNSSFVFSHVKYKGSKRFMCSFLAEFGRREIYKHVIMYTKDVCLTVEVKLTV